MKLVDKIKIAFSDLTHRKFRSLLTIIAISIGSLLLVAMMGLGDGIINQSRKMIESFGDTNEISIMPIDINKSKDMAGANFNGMSIGLNGEGSGDLKEEDTTKTEEPKDTAKKLITDEELEKIKNVSGVDRVTAYINGKITGFKLEGNEYIDRNVTAKGINFTYNKDFSEELIAGTNLKDEKNDVLIGENYLKKLGIENKEDVIGKKITIKAEYPEMNGIVIKQPLEVEGTIVGVLQKKTYGNEMIMSSSKLAPISSYFTESSDYIKDNGYDSASAFAKEGEKAGDVSSKIQTETGFLTMSFDMIDKMLDMLSTVIKSILSIAGIIVLVVAALGLVNTMTMTLQEKRKMIGVMRSVGGSRGNIRMIFIFQSILLGIAGGILGVILSSIGIWFVNEYVTKASGLVIAVTGSNIGFALGITIVISVIAGLIPSGKAAKLNVVEAVAEE
ncbi:ABC transporter permease [Clostridium paraputrificum]|uniref:ABC transporter permease n=1 Tax=Clostridium paraputrificum TaxID=29363 RepID=UPI003D330C80